MRDTSGRNPNIAGDQGKVTGAAFALVLVGLLVILGGFFILSGGMPEFKGLEWLGFVSLAEGALLVMTGAFTFNNDFWAVQLGYRLSLFGLVMAVASMNPLAVALRAIVIFFVVRGRDALSGVNERIDAPMQMSDLTEYYHHLVPLLAHVMLADGHVDRRERRKIRAVCDSMKISAYEQQRLVKQATTAESIDPVPHVAEYLRLAISVGVKKPGEQLLVAAVEVAASDGVLDDDEVKVIRALGAAASVPPEKVESLIDQHGAELQDLTPELARRLLNLGEGEADESIIRGAHDDLVDELDPKRFEHLGRRLSDRVAARRQAVERAFDVLVPGVSGIGPTQG